MTTVRGARRVSIPKRCARWRASASRWRSSGGLGPLAGRAFRIGHMGDINAAMLLGALAGVEAALRVQGIPIGAGGVQRAIEHLARG